MSSNRLDYTVTSIQLLQRLETGIVAILESFFKKGEEENSDIRVSSQYAGLPKLRFSPPLYPQG